MNIEECSEKPELPQYSQYDVILTAKKVPYDSSFVVCEGVTATK